MSTTIPNGTLERKEVDVVSKMEMPVFEWCSECGEHHIGIDCPECRRRRRK